MGVHALRRQFLLSSTMLMGALTGYSGRVYAACVTTTGTTYQCSGVNTVTQTINADNAEVLTVPGFSVDVMDPIGGNAITIIGDGALSFTDLNMSPLTAAFPGTALRITATGDIAGGNQGSITVDTNGMLSGRPIGIIALNYGTGAVNITANGDVTGTNGVGIYAQNDGTDLSVTTGAGTTVTGGDYGIFANNAGTGALEITANGDVTGGGDGIFAQNYGTNLSVTTGAGTTVAGDDSGINADNSGTGALTIEANGDVTGGVIGINAVNGGTDLTVTTAGTVTGDAAGIFAGNSGSGELSVTANGDVEGIYALNYGTNLSVTTGAGTTVTGDTYGIIAGNHGSGTLSITANGDVTGINRNGIDAANSAAGTDLSVTTAGTVYGSNNGIFALNNGRGALTIIASGDVTGTINDGIRAENGNSGFPNGTDLSVITGAGTTVTGFYSGIYADNSGSGALTIEANGDVDGPNADGIFARNEGTDLSVTTAGTVTGGSDGISAHNNGTGALTIIANGNVSATSYNGITALNSTAGTYLNVTNDAGTTVVGNYGIFARNAGTGMIDITVNGDVTGNGSSTFNADGIYVQHIAGGPIAITVGPDGTVTSDGSGAGAFAVNILEGPGTVTLAGTLNGGAGGALQFDQAAVLDDRLELQPGATVNGTVFAGPGVDSLVLGGTGADSFDVGLIGPGQQYQDFEAFLKEDASTWTLTGANALALPWSVAQGTLLVNGSLPNAPFSVDGGVLGGTGTIGALTVNNGGTVAPGASIGTLNVADTTFNPGSMFQVEVNAAGQSDKIEATGTAALNGGTVEVIALSTLLELANGADYTILTAAGGVAGSFDGASLTSPLLFLAPTLSQDANNVFLNLSRVPFANVAQTPNQVAVAGALDTLDVGNPLFESVFTLTTEEQARAAFDALSGEIHASVSGILIDAGRYLRDSILGRLLQASYSHADNQALASGGPQAASRDSQAMALGYAAGAPALGYAPVFWTRGYGAWAEFDTDANAAGADRNLGGFVSGLDVRLSPTWRAGLATGFTHADIDVDARLSAADVDSYHIAAYAGGGLGRFALRTGAAWTWHGITTDRAIAFPGFFELASADYDANTGQLFGELAYPMRMGTVAVEPFAGLAHVHFDADTFREQGGAAALQGRSNEEDVDYVSLGVRAATTVPLPGGKVAIPRLSAAWQHAFDDTTPELALAFAGANTDFGIAGVPLAEDSVLLEAGLDLELAPNATLGVSWTSQLASEVDDHGLQGRFSWRF